MSVFRPETFTFLRELAGHNDRAWFEQNRARYEDEVRTPALAFIEAVGERLGAVSPHFTAIARKTGGSLMRVHRDTRFGNDKTPYKTNVGIQFRHVAGKDVHAPGFYVHLEPGSVFVAAGSWRPESRALAACRQSIADNPRSWRQAISGRAFRRRFEFRGESLKHPPRGYPADHPLIDDLKRKDFIVLRNATEADALARDFVGRSVADFKVAAPLMRFLCEALDLPF